MIPQARSEGLHAQSVTIISADFSAGRRINDNDKARPVVSAVKVKIVVMPRNFCLSSKVKDMNRGVIQARGIPVHSTFVNNSCLAIIQVMRPARFACTFLNLSESETASTLDMSARTIREHRS